MSFKSVVTYVSSAASAGLILLSNVAVGTLCGSYNECISFWKSFVTGRALSHGSENTVNLFPDLQLVCMKTNSDQRCAEIGISTPYLVQ